MTDIPRFTHDCDSCVFLGRYTNPYYALSKQHTDLYYCVRCDGGSMIARYGSEGSEYMSAPIAVLLYAGYPSAHPLLEALRRQITIWQGKDKV